MADVALRKSGYGITPPSVFDWWNVFLGAAEIAWTREAGRVAISAAALRRTKALIEFAGSHSPFYRDKWRGIALDHCDLNELPVVTKPELMSRCDDWITDRSIRREDVERFVRDRTHIGEPLAGKYLVWKSSGSSGVPAVFLQDHTALAVCDALLAVQLRSVEVASHYAWGLLTQGGRAALVVA